MFDVNINYLLRTIAEQHTLQRLNGQIEFYMLIAYYILSRNKTENSTPIYLFKPDFIILKNIFEW